MTKTKTSQKLLTKAKRDKDPDYNINDLNEIDFDDLDSEELLSVYRDNPSAIFDKKVSSRIREALFREQYPVRERQVQEGMDNPLFFTGLQRFMPNPTFLALNASAIDNGSKIKIIVVNINDLDDRHKGANENVINDTEDLPDPESSEGMEVQTDKDPKYVLHDLRGANGLADFLLSLDAADPSSLYVPVENPIVRIGIDPEGFIVGADDAQYDIVCADIYTINSMLNPELKKSGPAYLAVYNAAITAVIDLMMQVAMAKALYNICSELQDGDVVGGGRVKKDPLYAEKQRKDGGLMDDEYLSDLRRLEDLQIPDVAARDILDIIGRGKKLHDLKKHGLIHVTSGDVVRAAIQTFFEEQIKEAFIARIASNGRLIPILHRMIKDNEMMNRVLTKFAVKRAARRAMISRTMMGRMLAKSLTFGKYVLSSSPIGMFVSFIVDVILQMLMDDVSGGSGVQTDTIKVTKTIT